MNDLKLLSLHDYKNQAYEQNNTEKDRLAFSSSQSKTARMFS